VKDEVGPCSHFVRDAVPTLLCGDVLVLWMALDNETGGFSATNASGVARRWLERAAAVPWWLGRFGRAVCFLVTYCLESSPAQGHDRAALGNGPSTQRHLPGGRLEIAPLQRGPSTGPVCGSSLFPAVPVQRIPAPDLAHRGRKQRRLPCVLLGSRHLNLQRFPQMNHLVEEVLAGG
jgi:hypothetical protein